MESLSFAELSPQMSDAARGALAAADVVIGVDRGTQCEFTVYGMPSLESTVILNQPSAMKVLRVTLDCDRGELDKLLLMIRSVKGLDAHRYAPA